MIKPFLGLIVLIPALGFAGQAKESRDPNTGLLSWKIEEPGLGIQFIQMLPDYVSALYSSRGLPPELIKGMAKYCVFGTIVTNESDRQLSYRVADWRYVTPDGTSHKVKTKTEWLKEWQSMGVNYRWSILPDDQTFEAGDWSQGFTTIPLLPESTFDLIYSWTLNGKKNHGEIKNLRCAPAKPPIP